MGRFEHVELAWPLASKYLTKYQHLEYVASCQIMAKVIQRWALAPLWSKARIKSALSVTSNSSYSCLLRKRKLCYDAKRSTKIGKIQQRQTENVSVSIYTAPCKPIPILQDDSRSSILWSSNLTCRNGVPCVPSFDLQSKQLAEPSKHSFGQLDVLHHLRHYHGDMLSTKHNRNHSTIKQITRSKI